ncbi:MAG TPA: hypothetical protein VNK96_06105 [Fimbriimonadales bacterium]|nr:hypothetical protein [Fimbriimonadales bacterium]
MKFFTLSICGLCILVCSCSPQTENAEATQKNAPSGMPVSPGAGPLTPVPDMAQGIEGSGGGVGNAAKEKAKSIASSPPTSVGKTTDSEGN